MSAEREADFLTVAELSRRTGIKLKTLYNTHSSGSGPLVEILTKLGSRLGAWRADYELWVAAQRRMKDEAA